jgi:glucose uptake protein GlcU
MIILMTLLIAGTSMAFAVHQWWRGHHMIAIGFITFACLMAGVAIEAAKNNQNAKATEVLRRSEGASAAIRRAP